ncbi:MAG: 5'-nucleotidase, lipoprotein e(P4) family [Gemmatimonadota bacterium]|nr:MAG: 5'-nucleotidase, lipoprotein e(P4) family [Gemmatimonadota bacterium]
MNPHHRIALTGSTCGLAVLLSACATRAPVPTPAPGSASDPPAIHWVRTAAEHYLLFEQTYAWITERVEARVSKLERGSWAVIVDADETVLDNSEYQLRRSRRGLGYTSDSWAVWVREEAAPALPGAVGFLRRVRELGGRVAVVTNRNEDVCDSTRRNLVAVGLTVDVVLCRQPGVSEKETRSRSVQDGTTGSGLPPLEIVAWVGDNIHDFPGGSQDLLDADPGFAANFGVRFFVLPNPMYGSWERNPPE